MSETPSESVPTGPEAHKKGRSLRSAGPLNAAQVAAALKQARKDSSKEETKEKTREEAKPDKEKDKEKPERQPERPPSETTNPPTLVEQAGSLPRVPKKPESIFAPGSGGMGAAAPQADSPAPTTTAAAHVGGGDEDEGEEEEEDELGFGAAVEPDDRDVGQAASASDQEEPSRSRYPSHPPPLPPDPPPSLSPSVSTSLTSFNALPSRLLSAHAGEADEAEGGPRSTTAARRSIASSGIWGGPIAAAVPESLQGFALPGRDAATLPPLPMDQLRRLKAAYPRPSYEVKLPLQLPEKRYFAGAGQQDVEAGKRIARLETRVVLLRRATLAAVEELHSPDGPSQDAVLGHLRASAQLADQIISDLERDRLAPLIRRFRAMEFLSDAAAGTMSLPPNAALDIPRARAIEERLHSLASQGPATLMGAPGRAASMPSRKRASSRPQSRGRKIMFREERRPRRAAPSPVAANKKVEPRYVSLSETRKGKGRKQDVVLQAEGEKARPRLNPDAAQTPQTPTPFFGKGPAPELALADRMRACSENWSKLGPKGDWGRKIVTEGVRAEWRENRPPPDNLPPAQPALSPAKQKLLDEEIRKLLELGAIKKVSAEDAHFYQRMFLVPKPGTKKVRPVLDCRRVNKHVVPHHFKMEGWSTVRSLCHRGDWLTRLDLSSAYLHVPLHEGTQSRLAFKVRGQVYCFRSLPFGLSSAPRIFTKLMRPLIQQLREEGIRCVIYLDDVLLLAASREDAIAHTRRAVELFTALGLTVNLEKSQTVPSHTTIFLGLHLDTEKMILSVPGPKLDKIVQMARKTAKRKRIPVRDLARVVGLVGSVRPVIASVHLHTAYLSRAVARAARSGWSASLYIPEPARRELLWVVENVRSLNKASLTHRPPTLRLQTDACPTGWGAALFREGSQEPVAQTWGHWPESLRGQHINVLETRACWLALKSFAGSVRGAVIRWCCDNTVSVWSATKWKARTLLLRQALQDLWDFAQELTVELLPEHVPGVTNTLADALSRSSDREDWKLHPRLCVEAQKHFQFEATVDAFASFANRQLPRFWSRLPQPESAGVDALRQNWVEERAWANPPFSVIGDVLALLRRQRATALLVYPCWPSQPWWPDLQGMLAAPPMKLPRSVDTFLPGVLGSSLPMGEAGWDAEVALVSGHPRRQLSKKA